MQSIKLNLIPGSVLPVINVSQYDAHRQFQLVVYEGATAYDLTGKTVEIRGTKPDGNGFAYDATDGVVSVSGNTVTISTTQQMTAVGGQTMAELRIKSGTTILSTINFILDVEHSALSDDTPISETEIPVIERHLEELVEEIQVYTEDAEAWAVGERDGEPVPSSDPTYLNNAKYYASNALSSASTATTKAGEAATSATNAGNSATTASNAATTATTKAGEASTSATNAENSATAASADSLKTEGWAVGEQGGTPVGPDSPYYHNNAAYYAQQSGQHAAGGINFQGSLAFADLPTVGMAAGDEYNITDDFTTDSRFIEGAGLSVKAGTNIVWVAGNVNKWDILATGGGSGVPTGGTTDQVLAKNSNTDGDTKWMNVPSVAEVAAVRDNGAVNSLQYPYYHTTTTTRGITYIDNGDGTITANAGTATGNSDFTLAYPFSRKSGTYIFSGRPDNSGARLQILKDGAYILNVSTGSFGTFTLDSDLEGAEVRIRIMNGTTIDSPIVFSPMIYDARFGSDVPFQPHAETNPVLTQKVTGLQKTGCVNTLETTMIDHVISGITFTVTKDGISTVGTNASSQYDVGELVSRYAPPVSGTYKLLGCPSGGSTTTYWLEIIDDTAGRNIGSDTGNGLIVTLDATHSYRVRIKIGKSLPAPSGMWKPMVTPDLSATYADCAPYSMTNRELTEAVTTPQTVTGYTVNSTIVNFDSASRIRCVRYGKVVVLAINIEFYVTGTDISNIMSGLPKPMYDTFAFLTRSSGEVYPVTLNTNGTLNKNGTYETSNKWMSGEIVYITTD